MLIPAYYDAPHHEGSVPMRGDDPRHDGMFSYVTPEARVRPDHPLRPIRRMTDVALERLSSRFDRLYSTTGRPSIPPEKLLRALLLQMLYSIRSERLLMEELDYNILYRWFVGLSLDDAVWDATTWRARKLSDSLPDVPHVKYFSVCGAVPERRVPPAMFALSRQLPSNAMRTRPSRLGVDSPSSCAICSMRAR